MSRTRRHGPGTVGYLATAYLDSTAFRNLSPATKMAKRSRLDWIREAIGQGRYAILEPRHVEALMAKKGGPNAANRLKKDLAQLFRFAAKRFGYTGRNPAALADGYKAPVGGHHTWTDEEIEVFRAAHPTGTTARLMLEIFLCTGAARQDAAALTRGNLRGDRLHYRRGKTGQGVDLPILPETGGGAGTDPGAATHADRPRKGRTGRMQSAHSATRFATRARRRTCLIAALTDCERQAPDGWPKRALRSLKS